MKDKTNLSREFSFSGTSLTVNRMGYGAMQLAGRDVRHERRRRAEGQVDLRAEQVLQRGTGALVRDVRHLDAGLLL